MTTTKNTVDPPLRRGEFYLDAEPRAAYVRTARNTRVRVVHYVTAVATVWERPWPNPAPAVFKRIVARTLCGDWLLYAELIVNPDREPVACEPCYQAEKRRSEREFGENPW